MGQQAGYGRSTGSFCLPVPPVFQPFHEHNATVIRTGLGEAEFAASWHKGEAPDLGELLRDFARFAVK